MLKQVSPEKAEKTNSRIRLSDYEYYNYHIQESKNVYYINGNQRGEMMI